MGAAVEITRYEPHRLELRTRNAQPGFLVLSEIYYRGWEAWLDGQRVPVERVNYALRGVQVPAGEHRLEMIFRAHSFRNGAAWSLVGVLLLLAGAVWGRLTSVHLWQERATARLRGLTQHAVVADRPARLAGDLRRGADQHASYAVGGSDSSGYASIARSLLRGEVIRPIPEGRSIWCAGQLRADLRPAGLSMRPE